MLAEPDLGAFVGQLESLAQAAGDEALLVGGWGSTEDVRIRAFPADHQGHLRIHVVLGEASHREHGSQLETYFETEPQPALRFASALRRAVAERQTGEFKLFVKGGAAV